MAQIPSCELVTEIPAGRKSREWNLRTNARNPENGHNHEKVLLSESPLYLQLAWRRIGEEASRHVGIFRLDLNELLKLGCIRFDPKNSRGPHVRLRVVKREDGFFIQTKNGEPEMKLPDAARAS